MSDVPLSDPIRDFFLALIDDALLGTRIPGGDTSAWLAPVPTAALGAVAWLSGARLREALFHAVGLARLRNHSGVDQNLFEGSAANVTAGPTANAALMAWAACRQARELLDLGFAAEAQHALLASTRLSDHWPPAIARRFEPLLSDLYAEADRARARHLADEVA